jgi:hypothetical protein
MWNPLVWLSLMSWLGLCTASWAQQDGFHFGMTQAVAEKRLRNTADYEVAYRVDTASTSDIFVRYRQHTLYLGHFLHGECVSVEKRAVVSSEARERMFMAYGEKLGRPDEGSTSKDGQLHFAKWIWRDRVLELSANARADGAWLLSHKELDPKRAREAVLLQQRELREQRNVLDPLTGLPLELARTAGEDLAAAQRVEQAEPDWEEALRSDATADTEGNESESDETKGSTQKAPAPRPRITNKTDWP